MKDREQWLTKTLLVLADTLISDFDVVEFLSLLADRLSELVEGADVGLVLVDQQGRLRVMGSSVERLRLLELFEVQSSEGPCLDCYRTGKAVVNVDLTGSSRRWPRFTPMARSGGYRMAHALPMRLREQVIGAANLLHPAPVMLGDRDLSVAQALADVATIGILQERAIRSATDLSQQLQGALNSRVVIEQAKGAVADRADVDMDTAFAWLRGYARVNGLRLTDVADAVVNRTLGVEILHTSAVRADDSNPDPAA